MAQPDQQTDVQERYRLPKVLKCSGYSRATLYRRIREGSFPQGRKDGRITYWPSGEIASWQARQPPS